MFKFQKEFPLLWLYKRFFDIEDRTVFAWNGCIYTNYKISFDLLEHEKTHLEQQKSLGLFTWLEQYLFNKKKRLEFEVEAYLKQLEFISDRNLKVKSRIMFAQHLSSAMYGNIITYEKALEMLK